MEFPQVSKEGAMREKGTKKRLVAIVRRSGKEKRAEREQ